jgi:hypothetical protein
VSPYREQPSTRWVCLGCYGHLADVAGLCPDCEIDLLPLDDAAVRDQLRAEAERRFSQKAYGEGFALFLLGIAITLPLFVLTHGVASLLVLCSLPLLVKALPVVWSRVQPSSALALYQVRREALASGGQRKLLPAHEAKKGEGDPEALDLEGTLRWLGIDEPKR